MPVSRIHDITAAILAGGAGTRLRSAVADRPKVLAVVAGKPFLAHLLDWLADQGIGRVVLCTGYLAEQVEAHFGGRYRSVELVYSREARPLGTAGALVQALPQVASETLLVLNGDSLSCPDLPASLQWHQARQAKATVLLTRVPDAARYGVVQADAEGRILKFSEKTGVRHEGWINRGIYWFERAALAALPRQEPFSLERDVLPKWIGHGLYAWQQADPFLDIGIPEDYARAAQFLEELRHATPAIPECARPE